MLYCFKIRIFVLFIEYKIRNLIYFNFNDKCQFIANVSPCKIKVLQLVASYAKDSLALLRSQISAGRNNSPSRLELRKPNVAIVNITKLLQFRNRITIYDRRDGCSFRTSYYVAISAKSAIIAIIYINIRNRYLDHRFTVTQILIQVLYFLHVN